MTADRKTTRRQTGNKRPWLRYLEYHPEGRSLDMILTFTLFAELAGITYAFGKKGYPVLLEFLGYSILTFIAAGVLRPLFMILGAAIGDAEKVSKKKNMRKFAEQCWRGTIHISMTLFEIYILNRPSVNWRWWTEIDAKGSTWEPVDHAAVDPLLASFYVLQLSLWSSTAINHRYHDARHKDYFVMMSHHCATIGLVLLSYLAGSQRVGLLVLLLHDGQDIFVDLVKCANYLGFEGKKYFFCVEILFVANLVTWGVTRLVVFPDKLIRSTYTDLHMFWGPDAGPGRDHAVGHFLLETCKAFLCVVCVMSAWWFYLFLKITYKLISQPAIEVSRDEYEGNSDEDSDMEYIDEAETSKDK